MSPANISSELKQQIDRLLQAYDGLGQRGEAVRKIREYQELLQPLSAEEIFHCLDYICSCTPYLALEGLDGVHQGMHALSKTRKTSDIQDSRLRTLQACLRKPLPIFTGRPKTADEAPKASVQRLLQILRKQAQEMRFLDLEDQDYVECQKQIHDEWQREYASYFN